MSTATPARTAGTADPFGTAPLGTGDPAEGRSSARGWLLLFLLVLVIVLLGALALPRGGDRPLDPDSAGPSGSRAVAEILRHHGVNVVVARTAPEAVRLSSTGTPSSLVVVHPDRLGPVQLDALSRVTARLVLVAPDDNVLEGLRLAVKVHGVSAPQVIAPGCGVGPAVAAGEALAGGYEYWGTADESEDLDLCYRSDYGPSYSYVDGDLDAAGTVQGTLIGQSQILTNRHLAEDGNAALALGTLGRTPRVVWYVPDPFEAGGEQPRGLSDLAPPWVRFLLLQLGLAAVLAMLWRGRRFGPLVTEPLPVVVRSAETLEGRASLYRQSHARDRAAATLRTAALRRLARRLDLSRDTTADTAAQLIAAAVGRPAVEIADLLLGPAPTSDTALVALAQNLDRLEDDLRTKDRT